MTSTDTAVVVRDDLFTQIHKALRLGLFELTVAAGRTDWTEPEQVGAFETRWRALLSLLRVHTAHEDDHIFRLLDAYDPAAADCDTEAHRDLDDLLDDLEERIETLLSAPEQLAGTEMYRDLTRFVAAYLPHIYDEETRVMDRIWACCTDAEIAAARSAFMAETPPEVMVTTLELMLPAIDGPSRRAMAAGLAHAPEPLRATVVGIAERVLPVTAAAEFRAAVS